MILDAAIIVGAGLLLYCVLANLIDGAVVRAVVGTSSLLDNLPETDQTACKVIRRRMFILNVVRPIILTVVIFGGGALTIGLLGLRILGAGLSGVWFFFLTQHACLTGRIGPSRSQATWAMVVTLLVILMAYVTVRGITR